MECKRVVCFVDRDCKGVMCSVDSNSQLQPLRHVVTVIWIVRGVMCSVDSDS